MPSFYSIALLRYITPKKTQKELEKRKNVAAVDMAKTSSDAPDSRANRSTVHLADPLKMLLKKQR